MKDDRKILTVYDRVITRDFVRGVLSCAGLVEREGIFQSSIDCMRTVDQSPRGEPSLMGAKPDNDL